jgi:hypothetical protein
MHPHFGIEHDTLTRWLERFVRDAGIRREGHMHNHHAIDVLLCQVVEHCS